MPIKQWESPRAMRVRLTADQRDFLRRRTRPFLDTNGVDRPLSFLLEEAYLQGMRDAVRAMEDGNEDAVPVDQGEVRVPMENWYY